MNKVKIAQFAYATKLVTIGAVIGTTYTYISLMAPQAWQDMTYVHIVNVAQAAESVSDSEAVHDVVEDVEMSVEDEIYSVATRYVGHDEAKFLIRLAMCESSLNPEAKNQNSTATGLFQFTKDTWNEGVLATGNDWTLADRTDVEKSVRMAIYYIYNQKQLSRWECKI